MKLIDTHAHLDHIKDLDIALREAAESGVEAVMAVGVDLASNRMNLEIKKTYSIPKIYIGLGIHPGHIQSDEIDQCLNFITKHADQCHAIGEIGLDFWYKWVRKDKEKKDEQRSVFQRQLEMAKELNLPAIIHTRGTWRESLEMTKKIGLTKALFHWYSGPIDVLDDILACGYFVSASPSLAYSPQSREAIGHAPVERILIETDSPVTYRSREGEEGFKASPKDVFRTLDAFVQLKGILKEDAAAILNQNAKDFFNFF